MPSGPLFLEPNGIDVWYIDESMDIRHFAVSAVRIPLLEPTEKDRYRFVWEEWLERHREFRRELKQVHGIPVRKELHAEKLVSGRGNYGRGKTRLGKKAGCGVFRWVLANLNFLPNASIITVVVEPGATLYSNRRLEAAMYALFQRMQRASRASRRNGMTFFDEGHGEYRDLYRRARVFLPTATVEWFSQLVEWADTHGVPRIRQGLMGSATRRAWDLRAVAREDPETYRQIRPHAFATLLLLVSALVAFVWSAVQSSTAQGAYAAGLLLLLAEVGHLLIQVSRSLLFGGRGEKA